MKLLNLENEVLTLNMMNVIINSNKNPSPAPVAMIHVSHGDIISSTRTCFCWQRIQTFCGILAYLNVGVKFLADKIILAEHM